MKARILSAFLLLIFVLNLLFNADAKAQQASRDCNAQTLQKFFGKDVSEKLWLDLSNATSSRDELNKVINPVFKTNLDLWHKLHERRSYILNELKKSPSQNQIEVLNFKWKDFICSYVAAYDKNPDALAPNSVCKSRIKQFSVEISRDEQVKEKYQELLGKNKGAASALQNQSVRCDQLALSENAKATTFDSFRSFFANSLKVNIDMSQFEKPTTVVVAEENTRKVESSSTNYKTVSNWDRWDFYTGDNLYDLAADVGYFLQDKKTSNKMYYKYFSRFHTGELVFSSNLAELDHNLNRPARYRYLDLYYMRSFLTAAFLYHLMWQDDNAKVDKYIIEQGDIDPSQLVLKNLDRYEGDNSHPSIYNNLEKISINVVNKFITKNFNRLANQRISVSINGQPVDRVLFNLYKEMLEVMNIPRDYIVPHSSFKQSTTNGRLYLTYKYQLNEVMFDAYVVEHINKLLDDEKHEDNSKLSLSCKSIVVECVKPELIECDKLKKTKSNSSSKSFKRREGGIFNFGGKNKTGCPSMT